MGGGGADQTSRGPKSGGGVGEPFLDPLVGSGGPCSLDVARVYDPVALARTGGPDRRAEDDSCAGSDAGSPTHPPVAGPKPTELDGLKGDGGWGGDTPWTIPRVHVPPGVVGRYPESMGPRRPHGFARRYTGVGGGARPDRFPLGRRFV